MKKFELAVYFVFCALVGVVIGGGLYRITHPPKPDPVCPDPIFDLQVSQGVDLLKRQALGCLYFPFTDPEWHATVICYSAQEFSKLAELAESTDGGE